MTKLYSPVQRIFKKACELKRGLYLVLLSTFLSVTAFAQLEAGNYNFTSTTGTFTPLGASATTVPAIQTDAVISGTIPLGFTFVFEGVSYTDVKASSDGFISFNTAATNTGTNELDVTTATRRPLVAPLWDDLDGKATGGSTASYLTTGTTGSRVFTFEWLNWEWRWNTTAPVISFQVKLYEGTNVIEFIYQQESGATNATATSGASIGIAGALTGAGNYLALNNSTSTPTASSTTENKNIFVKPATGQIYRFTPPVLVNNDAGVSALVAPAIGTGCFGATQNVTVTVKNYGTNTLSSIPVRVVISGGTAATLNGTFTGSLAPNSTANFTLPGTFNMSNGGNYTFKAYTMLPGEANAINDTITRTVNNATISTFPYIENFEGATVGTPGTLPAGWITSPVTGYRWEVDNANTSSTGTGPAVDHTLGTTAGKYVFTEASSGTTGDIATLESPCITLTGITTPGLEFWYHMYGVNMGTLAVDIYNGTQWIDNAFTLTGQQQASDTEGWRKARVNLSAYLGSTIKIRFRGVRGAGFESDIAIDDVRIFNLPAVDAAINALTSPLVTGCYSSSEQVVVTIKNEGSTALTSVPVTVNVSGAVTNIISSTFSGNIAPGASASYTVGTQNMSTPGVYNFTVIANLSGDGDRANDTLRSTRTVIAPLTPSLPIVTFTGFTGSNLSTISPGWYEATGAFVPTGTTAAWSSASAAQVTALGSETAKINLWLSSKRDWIVGPKFVNGTNTHILFKVAVTDYNVAAAGQLDSDDSLKVMISDDCGASFKLVRAFTATDNLPNTLTQQDIDLSAIPAGTELIVAFMATEGTTSGSSDIDLHLDDIHVKQFAPIDATPAALLSPLAVGCYGATESLNVNLANRGTSTLTSIPVTVRVNGPSGSPQVFTGTYTGSLTAGNNVNFTVPGTLNMSAAGVYNITVYTSATGDGDAGNDTIKVTRTVVSPLVPSLPIVTFTGFNSSNLSTISPGWYEATGATFPSGTTANWNVSNSAQTTSLGSETAKINLWQSTKRDWIVGPKFVTGTNTHILFKVAVTDYNAAGPDNMDSDDSLKVMISDDCGGSFKLVRSYTATDNLPNTLTQQDIDLSAIPAGTELIVAFMATEGTTSGSSDYDFHLDDINVKEVGNDDVGVISVRTNKGCGLTSTEQVCITVRNFGALPQTNIPVAYRVNNGTIVNDTIRVTLAPADTARYCFTATADLSVPGNYSIKTFTGLAADGITSNDSTNISVESKLSPGAPTTSNVTRCGPGRVTLSATAQTGASVKWYSSPTALIADTTAATYSPLVNATKTFYVAASSGTTETVGKASTLGTDGTNTGGGLIFNALQPFVLQSVVVYYNGAGATVTINLQNSSSTTLQSATVTLPATGGVITPITVPLNFNVPAGTGLKLVQGTSVGLYRDYSTGSNNFPYTSPSGNITITDGTLVGYYYFFYNWIVTSGCESARVPVTVTVTPAATIDATASQMSICNGASTTLSVTSPNSTYTYTWRGGALNGATGASQNVTPTATTTYIVSATDGSCQNFDTVTVTVSPVSVAGTASAISDTVCVGNSTMLRVTGSVGSIQWQKMVGANWVNETGAGATTATYTINPTQNSSYRAVVTSGVCSSMNTNTVNIIASNPQVTSSNGASRCGAGTINLTAAASAGANVKWYSAATGGVPLFTGATYSPNVTATTTYYVAASTSGGTETVGKASTLGTDGTNTGGGLLFNALRPFVLQSVVIYYNGTGGTLTINLQNSSSTTLQSATVTLPTTGGVITPITVPLNFNVPAGTGLKLVQGTSLSLYRDYSTGSNNFPYTSPSGNVTITDGTLAGYYYFFYNWVISGGGCESARTAVVATVNAATAPTIAVSGTNNTRSFSTTATGVTGYSWNFGDGSAMGTTANPSHTYAASGSYTVTLTVTYANGCTATSTQTVSVVIGVKEDLAAQVNLYPNPTSGKLYLELEKAEEAKITVHNMQGQVVRRASTHGEAKVVLDLDGLATGSYLIKVDNGAQMFTKKVLYQNLK